MYYVLGMNKHFLPEKFSFLLSFSLSLFLNFCQFEPCSYKVVLIKRKAGRLVFNIISRIGENAGRVACIKYVICVLCTACSAICVRVQSTTMKYNPNI